MRLPETLDLLAPLTVSAGEAASPTNRSSPPARLLPHGDCGTSGGADGRDVGQVGEAVSGSISSGVGWFEMGRGGAAGGEGLTVSGASSGAALGAGSLWPGSPMSPPSMGMALLDSPGAPGLLVAKGTNGEGLSSMFDTPEPSGPASGTVAAHLLSPFGSSDVAVPSWFSPPSAMGGPEGRVASCSFFQLHTPRGSSSGGGSLLARTRRELAALMAPSRMGSSGGVVCGSPISMTSPLPSPSALSARGSVLGPLPDFLSAASPTDDSLLLFSPHAAAGPLADTLASFAAEPLVPGSPSCPGLTPWPTLLAPSRLLTNGGPDTDLQCHGTSVEQRASHLLLDCAGGGAFGQEVSSAIVSLGGASSVMVGGVLPQQLLGQPGTSITSIDSSLLCQQLTPAPCRGAMPV